MGDLLHMGVGPLPWSVFFRNKITGAGYSVSVQFIILWAKLVLRLRSSW
jgi:hypothetical protein